MKILSIRLKNFLCYYGETTQIEFKDGLNLILGENGYGKSKLYDAFYWAIRDTISGEGLGTGSQETKAVKKGLISEKALKDAEPGDKVECCVILEIEDSAKTAVSYQITRSYEVVKNGNGSFQEPASSKLVLMRKDSLHFKPVQEADVQQRMSILFSADILPYMWFQGERGVDKLVDVSKPETLKTIINRLSDVSKWDQYIEVAEEALKTVETEYNRAARAIKTDSSRFDVLQETISKKRDAIKRKDEDLKATQNRNAAADERLKGVFGRHENAYELKSLKKEMTTLEGELKKIIGSLEELEMSRPRKEFSEAWLLEGTDQLFAAFEEKYKNYSEMVISRKVIAELAKSTHERHQTRLPKGIPDRVHVSKMLDEQKCLVCNREALKGTPEYEAIHSLLPELQQAATKDTNIEPELGKLLTSGRLHLEKASYAEKGRIKLLEKRKELQVEKTQLEDDISSLKNRIDSHIGVGEDPNDVIATYNNATQDIKTTEGQIAAYKVDLEQLNKDLNTANNEFRSLSKNSVSQKLILKKDRFQLLRDVASRLKVSQYKSLINQLEKEANHHYAKMNEGTGAVYGQIKFIKNTNDGITPTIADDRLANYYFSA